MRNLAIMVETQPVGRTCASQPPPPPPRTRCECSKCQPELKPKPKPKPNRKPKEPHKEVGAVAPEDMPLTDEMRKIGVKEIVAFRYRLWDEAGEQSYTLLATDMFIPDGLIDNILDQFPTMKTINDIQCLIEQHTHSAKHVSELFSSSKPCPSSFSAC
jgi:hypothetical protein